MAPSPPPTFGEHFFGVRERANRLALARWADQISTGRVMGPLETAAGVP